MTLDKHIELDFAVVSIWLSVQEVEHDLLLTLNLVSWVFPGVPLSSPFLSSITVVGPSVLTSPKGKGCCRLISSSRVRTCEFDTV